MHATDASELMSLFDSAPDWTTFRYKSDLAGPKAAELLAIYTKISKDYDVEECRHAIEVMMRDGIGLDKLYVFNRVYFKINENEPITHAGYSRGWTLDSTEKVGLLAPLAVGEQKKLFFKYRALAVMGPPYEPLKEFDYFRNKFERRYPKIEASKLLPE